LIQNMCLALYSKKQVTLLFEKHKDDYDYAMIVRPDTRFDNKFNVSILKELNETNIIIPIQDQYTGCNDRFSIGRPDIILYYGTLFDDLKEYSKKKPIVSEQYLLDKLNEKKVNDIYFSLFGPSVSLLLLKNFRYRSFKSFQISENNIQLYNPCINISLNIGLTLIQRYINARII